ncbi:phosphoribosyltransferase-like protein [Bradyrhizobium elkanii]|jgi:hypothetical protein|uniref:phosphoribosyltransferase-like protein n=1 Tax=Bradyrhizobium elkanii TaxID=29448 RepID=UPI00047F6633|nr:ATP-binding protein [Bradyrhizobium elkanii]MCP1927380.1 energy-coupling factor transporter ATP-binding protein EcfA2 [Bradyrhizobium elkanii]MCS3521115.1 energy-coupling factor transporter ATP-binding protein EcfA2 [Bradyrhizobium elkanii]MCS4068770.1 energy-coupling factor transporter ATP-binding protein EcfA2 [Bradyrhizobium elkanii]MCS4084304.1 energy-coupling factor transporter ATP-binding protein EcfA2 [Bradyrhizobium elkanii]MCW2126028.1 energy-coupling factor transporter ATP-binding
MSSRSVSNRSGQLNKKLAVPPALWAAILDFGSGRKYVWDEQAQTARVALAHETSGFLPTVTQAELAEWRTDFAGSHQRGLKQDELRSLLAWQSDGIMRNLPLALQNPWKAELVSRVVTRIEDHFANRGTPSPVKHKRTARGASALRAPTMREPPAHGRPSERLEAADVAPSPEAMDDELAAERLSVGDHLGFGEALVRKLKYVDETRLDSVIGRIAAAWASPARLVSDIASVQELVARAHEFVPEDLGVVLVHALSRLRDAGREMQSGVRDLVFRLSDPIATVFEVAQQATPMALAGAAIARLDQHRSLQQNAVAAFQVTNTVTAKGASIDLLRNGRNLTRMVLPGERPYVRELEVLLGAAFRKFCEACERHDDAGVLRRAAEIREHLSRSVPTSSDPRAHSEFWKLSVQPVYRHVEVLLDEGAQRSEVAASPHLVLATSQLKLNLSGGDHQTAFACRLLNNGDGRALQIEASVIGSGIDETYKLEVIEPMGPFDVAAHSEQLVTFGLTVADAADRLEVPLKWTCGTATGRQREFDDRLILEQQHQEPDWDKLLANPPYTLNPIRDRELLFGRARVLQELQLHVASGTSTFLWGQKRVGKTSLLQVLAAELEKRSGFICLILRMGELIGMHEGQIAHAIGSRLNERCDGALQLPSEAEFGAGMGQLVPFVERLLRSRSNRYVIIIDEFDDLDPAIYMGERGRQFVKALRSLSELGVTFFFVGSERMDSIYRRHQADLNKWLNMSLNRIESIEDCKTLVTRPVHGSIEYEQGAVRRIIDYCAGNPFYTQIVCFEVFKRCLQERRTFVSESDVIAVADTLVRALGQTNFVHFWEDNPELDAEARLRQSAENCLVLTCLAAVHGAFESIDELYEAQTKLLPINEQVSVVTLREIVDRLRRRGVLVSNADGAGLRVEPPIFRDWLNEYAEILLLRNWREFSKRSIDAPELLARVEIAETSGFPISEDDLLAVSQRLLYCGKQKDVAEVRAWLRQFDDDARIEIAFLLLRRMAERGYVTEGERTLAMQRVEEVLKAPAEPPVVWRYVRGRADNLCVSYVDSDTKSGASTAREVAKLLRPGKCAAATEIGGWLRSHLSQDSVLALIDDFAGSGGTVIKGLKRLAEHKTDAEAFRKFCETGHVHLILLFAFPEAIRAIKEQFPKIKVTAIRVFDDEVRALEPDAKIFGDEGDLRFAQDILRQIGQQLVPQHPIGHANLGGLVLFHNTVPNNTLPIFWCGGTVNERLWHPLFPRASWS